MSTLKEKFESYSPQPDAKVWDSISDTIRHAAVRRRRRIIGASAAAVVAAAAVVVLVFSGTRGEGTVVARAVSQPVAVQGGEASNPVVAATPSAMQGSDVSNVVNPAAQTAAETAADVRDGMDVPQPEAVVVSNPEVVSVSDHGQVPAEGKPSVVTPSPARSSSTAETDNNSQRAEARVDGTESQATDMVETSTMQDATSRPTRKASISDSSVWIPNAFAPDDPDDAVRLFKAICSNPANIQSFEMHIYNRGGRQVFHTRDINQAWDGTANGHAMPAGAYVYVVQYYHAAYGLQQRRGTVTLIR